MTALRLLVAQRFALLGRYFRRRRAAKGITAVLFIAVLGTVAAGIYLFFERGFRFLASDTYLFQAIALYVIELFLLVIMFLVFVSAVITTLLALFRNERDDLILASPRFGVLPWFLAFKTFVASLWPLVLIAVPALFGIQHAVGLAPGAMLVALAAAAFLVLVAVLGAQALVFLVGVALLTAERLAHRRFLTPKSVIILALCAVVVAAGAAWQRVGVGDVVALFGADDPSQLVAGTAAIASRFTWFPSHAASLLVWEGIGGRGPDPLAAATLAGLAVLGLLVLRATFAWYLPLAERLSEGSFVAEPSGPAVRLTHPRFPRYARTPLGAVLEKEAAVFFRNARNVLWLGFLFFLWLVQTSMYLFIRTNRLRYGADAGDIQHALQVFQLIIVVYFVSAFVLRFAFPSMSAERKTAWIFASAPVPFPQIFRAKLTFYSAAFLAMGLAVSVAGWLILGVPLGALAVSLALCAITIITVTVWGMSLGALFPNFETDDPETLSTSLPGLAFVFTSLLFGAGGGYALDAFFASGNILPLVGFVAAAAFVAYFSYRMAAIQLERTEFVPLVEA